MGEGGDLYRLNPYARPGEQLEVHDRLWVAPQPHAFCLGRFQLASTPGPKLAAELCAVLATHDRVVVCGLFSRQRQPFSPVAGEQFLVSSRDAFQFVVAFRTAVYIFSRYAEQISFCELNVQTGEIRRLAVAYGETAMCGPVLLADGDAGHVVIWSSTSLSVYTNGSLTPVALPEGVELCTTPIDVGLRLPPGRNPAIAGSGQLFLAARHFGRPALVRLARNLSVWATTAIAVIDEGTLGESRDGHPLISAANRLLTCTETSFRTLVHDPQISTRFPAWTDAGLALFFCEANYGGLKQWLKADAAGDPVPVSWDLPPGAEVHACEGFWSMGTTLCSICVVGDRGLRTEFLSWCV